MTSSDDVRSEIGLIGIYYYIYINIIYLELLRKICRVQGVCSQVLELQSLLYTTGLNSKCLTVL